MNDVARTDWHAAPAEEALHRLDASPRGLSREDAAARLERYGPNALRQEKRRSWIRRLGTQFNNVLIYVLIVSGTIALALGEFKDAAVIYGAVLINAVIGFVQEGRAESALAAVGRMMSPQATVLRDGERITIPAGEVVPGDVVFLQSGDRVPADLRLFEQRGLRVQEAALTGESLPVDKQTQPVAPNAALGDRGSMAYAGTLVAAGRGTGVVVATGQRTELGRIGEMLGSVEQLQTPLLAQIGKFGRWLTAIILVVAGATFLVALYRGYPLREGFMAAVGIAVAAIPEGLPAVITIALAVGVQRMARRNALIRRLPAVETLGSVDVVCTDKTGTLTRNEMMVEGMATSRHLFEVTGSGYAPEGEVALDGERVTALENPILERMTRAAALCTESRLRRGDEGWIVEGDPTEGALLAAAMKVGHDLEEEARRRERRDIIPFESEARFMATLHREDDSAIAYVKGAPERVFAMCARQAAPEGDEDLDVEYWRGRVEEMSARGERVLAVASRTLPADYDELRLADIEADMTLLGLFGMADPPRPEAIDAIARCRSAGVRVKMITGDHALTARAIAARLGLENPDDSLTGPEIDALDDSSLEDAAAETDVFARAAPEHKLRLIQALQADGKVIAMTGDGVNDAPALRRADVGVAMGLKGTETAKEASLMVLADDNFASIAAAVEEGRTARDDIMKTIAFMMPTSAAEALLVMTAILFGLVLPVTPTQILWVNMVTSVTLALALAVERAEPDVMRRPPVSRRAPLLTKELVWRSVFIGLIMLAASFGVFVLLRVQGDDVATARTAAVNAIVLIEIAYVFSIRFLLRPSLTPAGLFGSPIALGATAFTILLQLAFIYAPPMQALFETRPLGAMEWAWTIGAALFVLVVAEIWKFFARRAGAQAVSREA